MVLYLQFPQGLKTAWLIAGYPYLLLKMHRHPREGLRQWLSDLSKQTNKVKRQILAMSLAMPRRWSYSL